MPGQAESLLPDFPPGPLDRYRRLASFDWKRMALLLDGEEGLRLKWTVWRTLEADPEFAHPTKPLSLPEVRRRTFRQCRRLFEYSFLTDEQMLGNPLLLKYLSDALVMYDKSLVAKYNLSVTMFGTSAASMGKEHSHHLQAARNYESFGCFALTELAHGSDTKSMRTRATFDAGTQCFVFSTPGMQHMKAWSGNLGHSATHALVYAQLHTADGRCHGLHSFVVPIRDPQTLLPYPGVVVGDMGEKVGMNGVDNGFLLFNDCSVPRDCLLNRTADVTEAGEYVSKFKYPSKRFGAALAALSIGRVSIVGLAAAGMRLAVVIAVRYSAARRQFAPAEGGEELPVIEYGMQQLRLLPLVAAAYAWHSTATSLFADYVAAGLAGGNSPEASAMGKELHALSCAAKAASSWQCVAAAQECREACGGHGYLAAGRLGRLRNDFDAACTYEGDNHVLLQQTVAYLLAAASGQQQSPFGSLSFLAELSELGNWSLGNGPLPTCERPAECQRLLLRLQRCLLCRLLRRGADGLSPLQLKLLVVGYAEAEAARRFRSLADANGEAATGAALLLLSLLYSAWCLYRQLGSLYEEGCFGGCERPGDWLRRLMLDACRRLKDDAVALVDALAPSDFVLNSVLGHSSGKIYDNLVQGMLTSAGAFERPDWWREFVDKPQIGCRPVAKL